MQDPVQSVVSPHPVACNPTSCPSSPHMGQCRTFSELPHPQVRMKRSFHMCVMRKGTSRGPGELTGLVWGRGPPIPAPAGSHLGPQPWRHTSQCGQGSQGCSARGSLSSVGQENVSNSSKTQGEKPWSLSHLPAIPSPILQIWKLRPREVISEGQDHTWHLALFFCY